MPPVIKSRSRLTRAAQAKKKAEQDAIYQAEAAAKEAARLEEEKRLREEAEEKARVEKELRDFLESPGGQMKDLQKWLNSIPVLNSKCLKRLDRDCSDGVVVAEIVGYYCPELVDVKRFFPWNSSSNKRSNWTVLNRKVFPELGFELTPEMIDNLVRPFGNCGKHEKSCIKEPYIYEVLRELRDSIALHNPSVFAYRDAQDYNSLNVICKITQKKYTRPPRIDMNDPGKLPFSKIELEIANGKFDLEDRCREEAKIWQSYYGDTCQNSCDSEEPVKYCIPFTCPCNPRQFHFDENVKEEPRSEDDWVRCQGPGGGLFYEEGANGDFKVESMCPPCQNWMAI